MSRPVVTVFKLIYTSVADHAFSASDLVALLDRAQHNNVQHGLSGLLLLRNGRFMQLIEGAQAPVEALYQRITEDKRHTQVVKLLEVEGERRAMPDWHMGFSTNGPLARDPSVLRSAYFISPDTAIGLCGTLEAAVSAAMIDFLQSDQ